MLNLIRKLLNGFINMTSKKSEEKEVRMFNFTTNIPLLDKENRQLFQAANILEAMGNDPGLTANEFHRQLALSELPTEEFEAVTLAAIAIETMINADLSMDALHEPTVH